jgi:hypothetical protein
MCVRSSKAVVGNTDVFLSSGPWPRRCQDLAAAISVRSTVRERIAANLHVPLLHGNVLVGLAEIGVRQDQLVFKHHSRFDDRNHPTRALQVADVGFHGSDVEGISGCSAFSERPVGGSGFNGISHLRSGAVHFCKATVQGIEVGIAINAADQLFLSLAIRQSNPLCFAVLVDTRIGNDGSNGISVPQCGIERLQDDDTSALTSGKTGRSSLFESICSAGVVE